MVWGCISAYGMDSLHVLEGTMNAKRYIKQHMLPTRRRLFQGRPNPNNAKPHTAAITTAWLCSRTVPAVQIFHLENIWCIIKRKIHQRRQQTLLVKQISLNICYVICVLLLIKYWLM